MYRCVNEQPTLNMDEMQLCLINRLEELEKIQCHAFVEVLQPALDPKTIALEFLTPQNVKQFVFFKKD